MISGVVTREKVDEKRALATFYTANPSYVEATPIYWNGGCHRHINLKGLASAVDVSPEKLSSYFSEGIPTELRPRIAKELAMSNDQLFKSTRDIPDIIETIEGSKSYAELAAHYIAKSIFTQGRNELFKNIPPHLVDIYALQLFEDDMACTLLNGDGVLYTFSVKVSHGTQKPSISVLGPHQPNAIKRGDKPVEKHEFHLGNSKKLDKGLLSFAKHIFPVVKNNLNENESLFLTHEFQRYSEDLKSSAQYLKV